MGMMDWFALVFRMLRVVHIVICCSMATRDQ